MLLYSDFSLKGSNTFNVEAKADIYFEISARADIDTFVRKRKYFDLPRLILGNGSNILFTKDFKGVVLKNSIKGIETISEDEQNAVLKVASGEDFDTAFGLMHAIEKASEILIKIYSVRPEKLQTITVENFHDFENAFGFTLPEKYLYKK